MVGSVGGGVKARVCCRVEVWSRHSIASCTEPLLQRLRQPVQVHHAPLGLLDAVLHELGHLGALQPERALECAAAEERLQRTDSGVQSSGRGCVREDRCARARLVRARVLCSAMLCCDKLCLVCARPLQRFGVLEQPPRRRRVELRVVRRLHQTAEGDVVVTRRLGPLAAPQRHLLD